jgi:3-hydroxyisobutyrate dehydrogenase
MDVAPTDAATLFDHFNPGAALPTRFRRTLEAAYDHPSWSLAMARKDAGLMVAEAAAAQVPLATLPTIAAAMDALLAEGHAEADWTILARDALAAARR